jgi:hypothetical protein
MVLYEHRLAFAPLSVLMCEVVLIKSGLPSVRPLPIRRQDRITVVFILNQGLAVIPMLTTEKIFLFFCASFFNELL